MSGHRLSLAVVLMLVAACGTNDSSPSSTTVSTTTTAPVATTTTTLVTTTTSPPTTTTTTNPTPPSLVVVGAPIVYSVDGSIVVEGWVDRPAEVTVGGAPAFVHTEPSGRTSFSLDMALATGEHEVPVEAVDSAGMRATRLITITVDPTLEEELAYIQDLDATGGTVVADYVQWLTGDEAVAAAREDGVIGPDDPLDGDFYIRNQNPRLRTLELSDSLVVVLYACYPEAGPCLTREPVDLATWAMLVADPQSAVERLGWYWYGDGTLPYWLTLRDGTILQIDEHYLP